MRVLYYGSAAKNPLNDSFYSPEGRKRIKGGITYRVQAKDGHDPLRKGVKWSGPGDKERRI